MAFDSSRYLTGASTTPAIYDDGFVIDVSPFGGDIDTTAPEFLDRARARSLARLELMTAGARAPVRTDRAQALLGEFVLVAPEQQLEWHLGRTWVRDQSGKTSTRSSFEDVALPRGHQLSAPAASPGCVPCSSRSSTIPTSGISCADAWRSFSVPMSTMTRSESAHGASTTPGSDATWR